MRSKNSCFDIRIFGNALRRYWPICPAAAAVYLYDLLTRRGSSWYGIMEAADLSLLRSVLAPGSRLIFVAAGVVAMAVYSWLFFQRSTAYAAALPVRREAQYLSHMAAGFVLLEAAALLALLLFALTGGLRGAAPAGLLRVVAVITLLNVLFFGLASLCAVLTGNIIILPAVYAVFAYAAVALEASVRWIAQFLVFGLSGQRWLFTILSPVYYLCNAGQADFLLETNWQEVYQGYASSNVLTLAAFRGWPLLLCYGASGVLFAALGMALIRRRPMENAGNVVALPGLRRLFPWGAALAGALSLGLLTLKQIFRFSGYLNVTGSFSKVMLLLLAMILGAFTGWFGAHGLLRKTFRVFDRSWGGFAVFCAVLCALVLGTELDVTGSEKRLPDAERVASVSVWDTYAGAPATVFEEPENIRSVLEIQRHVLESKELFENAAGMDLSAQGGALSLVYCDENGRTLLSRAYVAPIGAMAWSSAGNAYATDGNAFGSANPVLPELEQLLNTPEAIRKRILPRYIAVSPYTIQAGYVYRMEDYVTVEELQFTAAETWELYNQCVLPDAEEGTVATTRLCPADDPGESRGTFTELFIPFSIGYGDDAMADYVYFMVRSEAARTVAWLAERGFAVTGTVRAEPEPSEIISESVTAVLPGLAGLLEKVYLEYDPAAAGTVGALRWTRSMLEWYSANGEDPFRVYEEAKLFARTYDAEAGEFRQRMEQLRTAGIRLTTGSAGLVQDRGRNTGAWTEDMVGEVFDAIAAGLAAAERNDY